MEEEITKLAGFRVVVEFREGSCFDGHSDEEKEEYIKAALHMFEHVQVDII